MFSLNRSSQQLSIFSLSYHTCPVRSESSCSTGALGSSAWRNPERKTKHPWAPVASQTTSTPTLLLTTPALAAFRWPPSQGRRPPSQPRPTGTWTCTLVTTQWAQTTLHFHRALTQVWWCAAVASIPMGPPSMTSTRNRRGLCCWNNFQKFPESWKKCNTLPGASGIRTKGRRSAASGSLRRLWWIGYAWWPSHSSPSSAPSPSSCQLPTSLRPCPKTSHKAGHSLSERREKDAALTAEIMIRTVLRKPLSCNDVTPHRLFKIIEHQNKTFPANFTYFSQVCCRVEFLWFLLFKGSHRTYSPSRRRLRLHAAANDVETLTNALFSWTPTDILYFSAFGL